MIDTILVIAIRLVLAIAASLLIVPALLLGFLLASYKE